MHRAHTIGATSRCSAPGAPTAAITAAGRQTKATRVAARFTRTVPAKHHRCPGRQRAMRRASSPKKQSRRQRPAPAMHSDARPDSPRPSGSPPAKPSLHRSLQGTPSADDRDRRLDRHGPVRRIRRVDLAGGPRRRDARVHAIGTHGLFPDDGPRRDGGADARIGLVREPTARSSSTKASASRSAGTTGISWAVTLAVELVAGAARDATTGSRCAGRLVGRGVSRADLRC